MLGDNKYTISYLYYGVTAAKPLNVKEEKCLDMWESASYLSPTKRWVLSADNNTIFIEVECITERRKYILFGKKEKISKGKLWIHEDSVKIYEVLGGEPVC
jgi:hypothetical protein